jgi:glycosyltransferase involved in cell wall biosynthesis
VKLIIVHHHLRPGGVRRVIELATPHLLQYGPEPIRAVVLAVGEPPAPEWLAEFRQRLRSTPVHLHVQPAFGYASELGLDGSTLQQRVRAAVNALLRNAARQPSLIWAHNLGLGRNLCLAHELAAACHRAGLPLVVHHHDWWFDQRWHHWAGIVDLGFRSLHVAAAATLPASAWITHLAINRADAAVLERHFPDRAGWLPNPSEPPVTLPPARVAATRAWLHAQLGESAPVWLMPCRLLRRKNIAEALLLTRWLRPEAWLVTTGGVSSAEEQPYADALAAAARTHRWRLRLGILEGVQQHKPTIPELLAASEVVLLTSLQEGFGLPFLEAASAGRPLLARLLPNIAPDLHTFGLRFPQAYTDLWVDPGLFDWCAERWRQRQAFAAWKNLLPRAAARLVGQPALLAADLPPAPVPFSRLTLAAQLEVLARPMQESWARCAPLNPWLNAWRHQAAEGKLQASAWPESAQRWLGGLTYARRFFDLVPTGTGPASASEASSAALMDFLRMKLAGPALYPLLWSSAT